MDFFIQDAKLDPPTMFDTSSDATWNNILSEDNRHLGNCITRMQRIDEIGRGKIEIFEIYHFWYL